MEITSSCQASFWIWMLFRCCFPGQCRISIFGGHPDRPKLFRIRPDWDQNWCPGQPTCFAVIPIARDASPKQVDALRWELEQKEKQSKRMSGSAFVTFKEKWGISGWLWQWRMVKIQCLQDVAHLVRLWLSLVLEDYSKCEPVKGLCFLTYPHVLRIANSKRFYWKIFPVVGSPSAEIRLGRLLLTHVKPDMYFKSRFC